MSLARSILQIRSNVYNVDLELLFIMENAENVLPVVQYVMEQALAFVTVVILVIFS